MNYCLINILGRVNKFFVNNRFSETIIKKNKNKVKPLANAILDKFLREMVALNIISLAKTRDVMTKKSGAINYGNHHLVVNNTIDILKLV